jgi:hypothetical protein
MLFFPVVTYATEIIFDFSRRVNRSGTTAMITQARR